MYCFQCQETAKNTGCTVRGVCGKTEDTANLQDLLIFVLKGIAVYAEKLAGLKLHDRAAGQFVARALFATITNANFDNARITALIREALERRAELSRRFLAMYKERTGRPYEGALPEAATWTPDDPAAFAEKAKFVGILSTANEDVRSLRELLVIGLKGIAAYAYHARILGKKDEP